MSNRDVTPIERPADTGAAREPPDVEEIRNALGRIVASSAFRESLRLTSFLKFVVETVLAGKSSQIKSYTIAVEALGRNSSFDPQGDPIVRVEARRLRDALARYYAGSGREDRLTIELPRGSYVPVFRHRTSPRGARKVLGAGRHFFRGLTQQRLRLIMLIAVVAAITSAFLDIMVMGWDRIRPGDATATVSVSRSDVRPRTQPFPTVAVPPFKTPGGAAGVQSAFAGLHEKLRDAIALDDDVALVVEALPENSAAPVQSIIHGSIPASVPELKATRTEPPP
jgi:hypothetical protein